MLSGTQPIISYRRCYRDVEWTSSLTERRCATEEPDCSFYIQVNNKEGERNGDQVLFIGR